MSILIKEITKNDYTQKINNNLSKGKPYVHCIRNNLEPLQAANENDY